jgi:hypothetical protein
VEISHDEHGPSRNVSKPTTGRKGGEKKDIRIFMAVMARGPTPQPILKKYFKRVTLQHITEN